jgi:starvation-inducible outer membrane lipoprotein
MRSIKTYIIKFLLTTTSLSFCIENAAAQVEREGKDLSVSMIRILAYPDSFNTKRTFFGGYLHCKFEDSAIYFSKDHADYLDGSNAIWVTYDSTLLKSIKPKQFDGKYVTVVGTFYANQHGHMGAFAGSIKVESIKERKRWYK